MKATMGLTARDMEVRVNRITASDCPAVMGTSPWKSQYDLYLEKCVEIKPLEPSAAMMWGHLMEPAILEYTQGVLREYHKNPNLQVTKQGCRRQHKNGVMSCTLDARCAGLPEAIEAKTHAAIHGNVDLSEWGDEWTDVIPIWYLDQVLAQLACAPDLERIWVVLSVGRMVPTMYGVERANHLARIAQIETTVCNFWDQFIIPSIPPAYSEPPSLETIRRVNVPLHDDVAVALPDVIVERRAKVNALKLKIEKSLKEIDASIKASLIGARRGVTPHGHQVKLVTYPRKGFTVEPTDVTRMDVWIHR